MKQHAPRPNRTHATRSPVDESDEPRPPEVGVPSQSSGQPLPNWVRRYFEERTRHDLSPVRIHQDQRAEQVEALAYTRGPNIHFRPGLYNPHHTSGRRLLEHELGHYVQQVEGRVPMPRGPGAPINADARLESEADRGMTVSSGASQATGAGVSTHGPIQRTRGKSARKRRERKMRSPGSTSTNSSDARDSSEPPEPKKKTAGAVARQLTFSRGRSNSRRKKKVHVDSSKPRQKAHDHASPQSIRDPAYSKTRTPSTRHRKKLTAPAKKAAKKHGGQPRSDSIDSESHDRSRSPVPRTNFDAKTKKAARKKSGLSARENLTEINGAIPHRMSFENMRNNVARFTRTKEDTRSKYEKWTDRFLDAGTEIAQGEPDAERSKNIKQQTKALRISRDNLLSDRFNSKMERDFVEKINTYMPNVPDVGQQRGRNLQVSKHPHLNMIKQGQTYTPSPMSRVVLRDMSPERLSEFPVDDSGNLIPVHGPAIPLAKLKDTDKKRILQIGTKQINADLKDYKSKKGYN